MYNYKHIGSYSLYLLYRQSKNSAQVKHLTCSVLYVVYKSLKSVSLYILKFKPNLFSCKEFIEVTSDVQKIRISERKRKAPCCPSHWQKTQLNLLLISIYCVYKLYKCILNKQKYHEWKLILYKCDACNFVTKDT